MCLTFGECATQLVGIFVKDRKIPTNGQEKLDRKVWITGNLIKPGRRNVTRMGWVPYSIRNTEQYAHFGLKHAKNEWSPGAQCQVLTLRPAPGGEL